MIHILHCYGHASVSLYSENAFAGHSIVKTVQCHIIISYCAHYKPALCIFSQFL